MRTVGAAEEFIVMLHAVTDDAASAMEARWSECLDRAFKTIKRVGMALVDDVE